MLNELVDSLDEVLGELTWEESGCEAEKAYDRAVQVRDNAKKVVQTLKSANCAASLHDGVLTLEDGTQINLV